MSNLTEHPTFRQVAWIGAGVGGLLTFVGALWLAVSAQSSDPVPKIKESSAAIRAGKTARRPPLPSRPGVAAPAEPSAPEPAERMAAPEPPPSPELRKADARPPFQPADAIKPSLSRPPIPRIEPPGLAGMAAPPLGGRLSQEELEKRREDRKNRQEDRLKNRIKTLEERIQSYRKDGTRTEAQIERMERSLERMKQRLERMDSPDGAQPH